LSNVGPLSDIVMADLEDGAAAVSGGASAGPEAAGPASAAPASAEAPAPAPAPASAEAGAVAQDGPAHSAAVVSMPGKGGTSHGAVSGTAADDAGSSTTNTTVQFRPGQFRLIFRPSGNRSAGSTADRSDVSSSGSSSTQPQWSPWPAARECRKCCRAGGEEQELLVCRGCMRVKYCSKECQRGDWRRHRGICRRLQLLQHEQQQ
jgi:hypothetical protein